MQRPVPLIGTPFPIPMDADFGHAPLGTFGKRAVQAVPAGALRLADAAGQPVLPGCALGSRLLNALSPAHTRVHARILAALTDSSKQVAQLLGQICDAPRHVVAGSAAKKLLRRLATTAAPITRQGVSLPDVLRQRVEVHAQHMTTSQLLTLRDGLECVRQSPDISQPDEIQLLSAARGAVNQALAVHVQALLARAGTSMQPALRQALARLPHEAAHPGAVAQQFTALMDIALALLQEQGFSLRAPKDCAAMSRELVQAFCSLAVRNATITHDQLRALLQVLPPQRQVELSQSTQRLLHTAPTAFLQALRLASQQWRQDAQQGLLHAIQALHAWPPPTGHTLVEQVIRFESVLDQLRSYFTARGEGFDSALGEIASQAIHTLQTTLLQPAHLPLAALSNRALRDLGLSMARLPMEDTAQRVAHAIRQRQAAAEIPYVRAMHALGGALRDQDFTAVLGLLAEAAHRRAQAEGIYLQLTPPGQAVDFRENRMRTAVQQWDRSTLLALRAALDLPVSCALIFTLKQLGNDILHDANLPHDARAALSEQLRNAHIDLQALRQAVVAQLGQHGIQSPPVQREIYGPADLDAGALDALGTRFGITLCQAGRALQVSIPATTARLGA